MAKKQKTKNIEDSTMDNAKLMQQVKEMEAKKREQQMKDNRVSIITQNSETQIDFNSWWITAQKRLSLRAWEKEIIKADFKGRGSSLKETDDKFYEYLKLYGIKF